MVNFELRGREVIGLLEKKISYTIILWNVRNIPDVLISRIIFQLVLALFMQYYKL